MLYDSACVHRRAEREHISRTGHRLPACTAKIPPRLTSLRFEMCSAATRLDRLFKRAPLGSFTYMQGNRR